MMKPLTLSGGQLAGGNSVNDRAENDFYATDPKAVEMLLNTYRINGTKILEPCVGQGHIADKVLSFYKSEYKSVTGVDIVDRGYKDTIVTDFLTWNTDDKYDAIITNPPYSLAKEFIEKGLSLLKEDGQMAVFLKLQFLEGAKRKEFFKDYPPKYIYVFRNRMPTWKLGNPINPDTGKKWAEVICFAWFIWEKGSQTEPIVRWL